MGYRIVYDSEKRVHGSKKQNGRLTVLTGLFFLLFCILVGTFWSDGVEIMRKYVCSGDGAITVAALEEMTDRLRDGTPLPDALQTFCLELFAHEKPVAGR